MGDDINKREGKTWSTAKNIYSQKYLFRAAKPADSPSEGLGTWCSLHDAALGILIDITGWLLVKWFTLGVIMLSVGK